MSDVPPVPGTVDTDRRGRRAPAARSRQSVLLVGLGAALALALLAYLLARWAVPSGHSMAPGARHRVYGALVAFGICLALVSWSVNQWVLGMRGIERWLRRPKIVRDVHRAIETGEFELHFQPQVNIDSGQPFAVEALLRWRHADGMRMPGDFLGDVEASDAMGPLTDHVLELALEQAGRWHEAGRPIKMSVNLSAVNLRDYSLPDRLGELLETHRVMPNMLTVEVTETAVLDEPEQTRAVLDAIAERGISISVDDFGTGYSSLLWLRLFPVTEVKIDRTFVAELRADGEAYVSGVVRLGHDLGLSVVAEGIEDEPTLRALQALGCDAGQGFLFSRAVPASELEPWFDEHFDQRWAPARRDVYLDADFQSLDAARDLIEEAATELGYDDEAVWDMRVAATEAVANAIEYGSPAADGRLHVRLSEVDGELRLEISGGGGASGPALGQAQTHRGRGFAIMTALMDEVSVRRDADDTLIRLAKKMQPTRP